MKNLFAFILILLTGSIYAQAQVTPTKEYTISISDKEITLAPGETKQLTVTLNRSKLFSHSKAKLGLSSSLPTGLSLVYEPAEGLFESSAATISASAETLPGEYQLILKSEMRGLTKGSVVKVIVSGNTVSKDAITAN